MELKTLKDLTEPLEFIQTDGTLKVIRYGKLKQEAIKWLKKYYHPDKTTIPIV